MQFFSFFFSANIYPNQSFDIFKETNTVPILIELLIL